MSLCGNWVPEVRSTLTELIRAGAGKHLPVVFDFDNTVICGDIGEATFAILVRDGVLKPENIPPTLSPAFMNGKGDRVLLDSGPDLTAYYESLLAPTIHGKSDPTPYANGYAWVVEIMAGLSPWQIVSATAEAFSQSKPFQLISIYVTPGKTAYPAPFFYPESVELIGELLQHDFDVWIVSASNAWSVRWMVQEALNPLLSKEGIEEGIRADHVVGVSTLLQDPEGRLYKDVVLVREDQAYASLQESALKRLRLTSQLQYPVPTYGGKVGCIWEQIGRQPYLAAGDSPGDLPMLVFSQHRLWAARMDKPVYQEKAAAAIAKSGKAGWMLQPVMSTGIPGFLSSFSATGKPA